MTIDQYLQRFIFLIERDHNSAIKVEPPVVVPWDYSQGLWDPKGSADKVYF